MRTSKGGSITIEAAIVIPIVLIIISFLVTFSLEYYNEIVGASVDTIRDDHYYITGEYRTERDDAPWVTVGIEKEHLNPKTYARIADALDYITDQITITKDLKENYNRIVNRIYNFF